jgi:hypothetical protein
MLVVKDAKEFGLIPYMDLNEQVDSDFTRARRRAFLRRVLARLRNGPASNQLLSFDEVRRALLANNRIHLGTKVVEVEKIVGTVGRRRDFDRTFLPTRASAEGRWKRIDRAFHRAEDLPPVNLYKIGDSYFVLDGNHRVSVARYHGIQTIEAMVTEFFPSRVTEARQEPSPDPILHRLGGLAKEPEPCCP